MEDPSISSVWRPWSISLTGTPEGTSEGVIVSFELFAIDPADAALRPKMGRRVGRAFSTRFLKKAAVSDLVKFVKDNLAEFIGRLACQPSVLFHVFDEHHKEVRLDDCVEHYVRAVARKGEDERREEAIFYIFAPYLPPGEGLWWEIEHLSKKRTIFDFEPKLDFNVGGTTGISPLHNQLLESDPARIKP
eukprot:jgi/Mesen1/4786/ME000242S03954